MTGPSDPVRPPGGEDPAAGQQPPRAEPAAGAQRDFDVFRLRLGHVIAFVAALALMFIMAGDWYSTDEGVRAREIEHRAGQTDLPGADVIDPGVKDDAREQAQKAERNAWQVSSALDVLVLVSLLVTVALAIAAAGLRATGRTFDPPRSPSSIAAGAAIVSFLLVLVQAVARLGPADSPAVFQVGLPLGVIALGAIALGSAMAVRNAAIEGEAPGGPATAGSASAGSTSGPGVAAGATYNRAP